MKQFDNKKRTTNRIQNRITREDVILTGGSKHDDPLQDTLDALDAYFSEFKTSTTDNHCSMELNLQESLAFLDDMVGMENVKAKLQRLGRYSLWRNKLEADGIDISIYPQPNLTFMFLGEPGTGKTTVARQMGKILHSIGLLTSDNVQEYRREDLVGQNYGSEENNTQAALESACGGVFFLDEAYQCFRQSSDKRDPGYHILETMMAHFGKPDRCIIMAGYKNEMMELFRVNPGFRSRIPDDNIIEFTGPTEQLLVDVATSAFDRMAFSMTPDASSMLHRHIHNLWINRDKDFGNARVMRLLADSVVINHANRIIMSNQTDDFTIDESDICQSLIPLPASQPRSRIGFT
ncbi:MAG: AAA family ATPase [Bacteroidaceae bacterium]|nr:AAA family ATPase [Bacteroidaceae bacterium]